MGTKINRHGLSRYIPAPIRRQIRRECNYACVICTCPVVTYEHIEPEWNDAVDHVVSKMVLLCGTCQDKSSRGIIPKSLILKKRQSLVKHTKAPSDQFYLDTDQLVVELGGATFVNPMSLLTIDGVELLRIDPPEDDVAPPRITGSFFDEKGG